jgi:hypothetical protein
MVVVIHIAIFFFVVIRKLFCRSYRFPTSCAIDTFGGTSSTHLQKWLRLQMKLSSLLYCILNLAYIISLMHLGIIVCFLR